MITKLVAATAIASKTGGSAERGTSIVGSGTIVTAAMAVKCSRQIASVSRPVPKTRVLKEFAVQPRRQRGAAEELAQRDRGEHVEEIPDDPAGNLEGGHAGEVHRSDAAADDEAADPPASRHVPSPQARIPPDGDDRHHQRQHRERHIVADRNARWCTQASR